MTPDRTLDAKCLEMLDPQWPYNWINHEWTQAHATAAIAEGWSISDTHGSVSGPWQICKFDTPEDVGAPPLEDDADAWRILMMGNLPHHIKAREFMQLANPREWTAMNEFMRKPGQPWSVTHDHP